MAKKQFSSSAIGPLIDALTAIYWYKKDLQRFIHFNVSDASVLGKLDFSKYKRDIASDLVDILISNQERYQATLVRICTEVAHFKDFSHLSKLPEDGPLKAMKAKEAVERFKKIVDTHSISSEEERQAGLRQKAASEKLQNIQTFQSKLSELKSHYLSMFSIDPNKRGLLLEKFCSEVFDLFDLEPQGPFKNDGEQIDGAFSFDSCEYLFEAKWTKELTPRYELDAFNSKIVRKLDNTLGLFLSINGFESSAVDIYSASNSKFILMTGADLMAVLENRIDLPYLIRRKKKHASKHGKILIEASQILLGTGD